MATSLQCIVYVLKNSDDPPRFYTGVTADLGARLEAHNAGPCSHTSKHRRLLHAGACSVRTDIVIELRKGGENAFHQFAG